MNIIYLSCHGILEYDEVKLLTEMGHDVFCIGDYGGNERPMIKGRDRTCGWMSKNEGENLCHLGHENLPDWAIDRCDAIISVDVVKWLKGQWDKIKHKKCFLRLIGQHRRLLGTNIRTMTDAGLKIIPYWPSDKEKNGLQDDQVTNVVRFYKDENEFKGWTGERRMILTACNDIMRGGGKMCSADIYKYATTKLPRLLVGRENRFFGDFTARVPYWMLKELYQQCKVYFYIGTRPASYTLNLIEAMMTGMPIIAYDNGDSEVRKIIKFTSSDPDELWEVMEESLNGDVEQYRCQNKAIELFGKQQAIDSWTVTL